MTNVKSLLCKQVCSCGVLSFPYIVKKCGYRCRRSCEEWGFNGNVIDICLNSYVVLMKYKYRLYLMQEWCVFAVIVWFMKMKRVIGCRMMDQVNEQGYVVLNFYNLSPKRSYALYGVQLSIN